MQLETVGSVVVGRVGSKVGRQLHHLNRVIRCLLHTQQAARADVFVYHDLARFALHVELSADTVLPATTALLHQILVRRHIWMKLGLVKNDQVLLHETILVRLFRTRAHDDRTVVLMSIYAP